MLSFQEANLIYFHSYFSKEIVVFPIWAKLLFLRIDSCGPFSECLCYHCLCTFLCMSIPAIICVPFSACMYLTLFVDLSQHVHTCHCLCTPLFISVPAIICVPFSACRYLPLFAVLFSSCWLWNIILEISFSLEWILSHWIRFKLPNLTHKHVHFVLYL